MKHLTLHFTPSPQKAVKWVFKQGYRCLFIKIHEFSLQPELKCLYVFSGKIHSWRKNPLRLNFSYLLITHWEGFLPQFIFIYSLQWPSITTEKAMKFPQVKKKNIFFTVKKMHSMDNNSTLPRLSRTSEVMCIRHICKLKILHLCGFTNLQVLKTRKRLRIYLITCEVMTSTKTHWVTGLKINIFLLA